MGMYELLMDEGLRMKLKQASALPKELHAPQPLL